MPSNAPSAAYADVCSTDTAFDLFLDLVLSVIDEPSHDRYQEPRKIGSLDVLDTFVPVPWE
jgi:hypothetical protein